MFEMAESGRNLLTKGYAVTSYYTSSGIIAGVRIYLNKDMLPTADACTMQAIIHEIGHGLGAKHTSNDNDVMYTYGADGCRYALSVADVEQLQYGSDMCYAELTPENDIYIPWAGGNSALLKYDGAQWTLAQYAPSAGNCTSVSMDSTGELTFTDVRRIEGRLSSVILSPVGDNAWSLEWAE